MAERRPRRSTASQIERTASRYRARLIRSDRRASSAMATAYRELIGAIEEELGGLADEERRAKARGEQVGTGWLFRQQRYRTLLNEADERFRTFGLLAGRTAIVEKRAAALAGQQMAGDLMGTGLQDPPSGFSASFQGINQGAVQEIVGTFQSGSPLRLVTDSFGPNATAIVRTELIRGIGLGRGLDRAAETISKKLGVTLSRAATVVRTESMRAFREASRQTYQANADLLEGWVWHADLSARTCAACWAMHGTEHPLDEPMGSHPNCRCAAIPKTKTWTALGFPGVPETRPSIESGEEVFRRLPPAQQFAVLGPGAYAAYRRGAISLADMVETRRDPVWGVTRTVRPLKSLGIARHSTAGGGGGGPTVPPSSASGGSGAGGIPVSAALQIPTGPDGRPIRTAVAAIDAAHTDGALPQIPVRRKSLRPGEQGYYDPRGYHDPQHEFEIVVGHQARRPELTMAHEVGHFLDDHGLGSGSLVVASVSDPRLAGWRSAVRRSQAYQDITGLMGQNILNNPALVQHLRYLRRYEELWARSYAQWVATRSQSLPMVRALDLSRERTQGMLYIPSQWEDNDFVDIADEIDTVFRDLGWIT